MKTRSTVFGAAIFCFAALFAQTIFAQKEVSIAEIQGDGNFSAFDNKKVTVSGIVTARIRSGFFIQTGDDKVDGNPKTSEGIFVYLKKDPPIEAAVGSLIRISGWVKEFRPKDEVNAPTLTEISFDEKTGVEVLSKANALPAPVALTTADFASNSFDQAEKYEGMRVVVKELLVVGPTDGNVNDKEATSTSNGIFFGVVKGLPRPLRESGFNSGDVSAEQRELLIKEHPKITFFDGNPERLRIESKAQEGATALDLASGVTLKNYNGILHFNRGTWTILGDAIAKPEIENNIKTTPLPTIGKGQFSIAAMNLENFFDDEDDPAIKEPIVQKAGFEHRLNKISLAIRETLKMPDVIGMIEVENLSGLSRLAQKINADEVKGGRPDPKYVAYLMEANDARGIDTGYLVKSSRTKVLEVVQLGKDEKYKDPTTGQTNFVYDRTPLLLRASITNPETGKPFEFTAIVNHFKSFLGYDDPEKKDNVRLKKQLQATFLAKVVQARQKSDATERIMLLGDFNAYQFNDGVTDIIGILKGVPAKKDEIVNVQEDLVEPNLINLVDIIDSQQKYSFVYDGNAQTLDHVLITGNLTRNVAGFGFARVNADFPEILRNDATRPERYSDHDPAIAYFNFEAK